MRMSGAAAGSRNRGPAAKCFAIAASVEEYHAAIDSIFALQSSYKLELIPRDVRFMLY